MRIVMLTSDKTAWMLRACYWLLDKYWPEHPRCLVGGFTKPQMPETDKLEWLTLGDFADYPYERWSDALLQLLALIPEEIFLWTLDDFWLVQQVDDTAVRQLYQHLLDNSHLARIDLTTDRLYAATVQDAGTLGPLHLVSTPPNTPYQLSFQTGLWRKEALRQYLVPGETAAEVEIRGSLRMQRAAANVLGTREAPFKYLIAMQHGQLVIDEGGYQVPRVELVPEDRAELDRLGYLVP